MPYSLTLFAVAIYQGIKLFKHTKLQLCYEHKRVVRVWVIHLKVAKQTLEEERSGWPSVVNTRA